MKRKLFILLLVLLTSALCYFLINKVSVYIKAEEFSKQGYYQTCGCGCCPGYREADIFEVCLYRSKGDSLKDVIAEDIESRNSPLCNSVGCSFAPTKYVYCD
jgi:hypothetical protein